LLVFFVSLGLVLRFLITGEGAYAADLSIVAKTLALYTIMVTGAIWEKVVFGRYLFAPAFFWEDAASMVVIALHTIYLVMLFGGFGSVEAACGSRSPATPLTSSMPASSCSSCAPPACRASLPTWRWRRERPPLGRPARDPARARPTRSLLRASPESSGCIARCRTPSF
jgi:hypothetical protein